MITEKTRIKLGAFWLMVGIFAAVIVAVLVFSSSANAEYEKSFIIRHDGSTNPADAPVTRDGEVYTLTDDVAGSVDIRRAGITFDGAEHSVSDPANLNTGVSCAYAGGGGVTIMNVHVNGFTNGITMRNGCTIINNVLTDNRVGILVSNQENFVSGNVVSGGVTGIRLSGDGHTISGNIVMNSDFYGISLGYGDGNTVEDNVISDNHIGIFHRFLTNSVLSGNILTGNTYSLFFHGNDLSHFTTNSIDTTNAVDGKRVYYLVDQHGVEISPATGYGDAGYLALVNSDEVIVKDLAFMNAGQGVLFAYTDHSRIENVEVTIASEGIELITSCDNTITGCTVSTTSMNSPWGSLSSGGIYARFSSHRNTIENNVVSHSAGTGIIAAGGDFNVIRENTIEITIHAGRGIYCYGTDNIVSQNTISGDGTQVKAIEVQGSRNSIIENTVSVGYIQLHYAQENKVIGNIINSGSYYGYYGIRLLGTNTYAVSYNTISGNSITGSRYGMYLRWAHNNEINENTITDCRMGIQIRFSDGNLIFHNNFIDNRNGAYDDNPSNNDWHHPELLEGNYWSDYEGEDTGLEIYPWDAAGKHLIADDGIGDTDVPHHTEYYDYYPFIEPDYWLNQPPVAEAGGPYDANEGTAITFDASGSSDPDDDPLQYRWDFDDDGNWDTPWSPDPTTLHTWDDDYSGSIYVEVTDGQFSNIAETTIMIHNVVPSVDVGYLAPRDAGEELQFSGSFLDPGLLDTHDIEWNMGDGTIITGTLEPIHAYDSDGDYLVTLTVIDDDGGEGSDSFTMKIYDFTWHPPLKDKRTFHAGRTIPIKFSLFRFGEFIRDESVQVTVTDNEGNTVFLAVYGNGDGSVRIDAKGSHYITNWHTDKDMRGEYTISISFDSGLYVEKTIELVGN